MALRIWPEETLQPAVAQERLRRAIHSAIAPSLEHPVRRVLDVGDSLGAATRA